MKHSFEPSVLAAAMLALFWCALPVTLPRAVNAATRDACVVPVTVASARAIQDLEQCRLRDPQNVETLAELGAAYQVAGDLGRAEASYRRVLELDPEYADVRLTLARLLLERGDSGGAEQQATIALRVQPNRRALIDVLATARSGTRAARR